MGMGMEGKGATPSPNHEVDRPQTGGGPHRVQRHWHSSAPLAATLIRPVGCTMTLRPTAVDMNISAANIRFPSAPENHTAHTTHNPQMVSNC